MDERAYLLQHAAHDYGRLIERWRAVADKARLKVASFAEESGYPIYGIRSQAEPDEGPGLYLCAGVHGDEPGGVQGLIEWAEENVDFLSRTPCAILPCLNPWGLVENRRIDGEGVDLNRAFHLDSNRLVAAWRGFLGNSRFRLALCLHEDYDATGIYIYELSRPAVFLGEPCLQACEAIIPRDRRKEVEDRPFENGLLRADRDVERLVDELEEGLPEAIYLYLHHARLALTFETPSEYSLYERVRAQVRFLETAIECSGIVHNSDEPA